MEVIIRTYPNLLVETADLVCACYNHLDPRILTADKPYCIPASAVGEMMAQIREWLDMSDPRLEFLFQCFPVAAPCAEGNQPVGVGNLLARDSLKEGNWKLDEIRSLLHGRVFGQGGPYQITAVSAYGIDADPCEEYRSVAAELRKVDISDELRLRLTEMLSNYHYYVDMLCDLLLPVAKELEQLLSVWVEQVQGRVEQWRSVLSSPEGLADLLSRINTNTEWADRLIIGLHLFYPAISIVHSDQINGDLRCCAGLAMPPLRQGRQVLEQMEMAALRLMSGTDRMEMLRAMSGRTMTRKDIVRELGINSGTVFRDLNALTMAQLLRMENKDGVRHYTTNLDYVERVASQMVKYIRNGD